MDKMNFSSIKTGVFAFSIVLLCMPLGHALMVLNEKLFTDYKLLGAVVIGVIGLVLLGYGITKNDKKSVATLLGLMAAILIWTGWVEFSFVWIADKFNIPGLIENGIEVTKPEYLIMPSSIGLLAVFLIYFLFTFNNCQFFNWFQALFGIKKHIKLAVKEKPIAVTTFIESVIVLWTFYIILLLVYDKNIAGDKHFFTYFVAFGSLFWSIYLLRNLLRIKNIDYAIRYAVPTVIIFWNFIEILGRWNMFKEIWVHPFEHWLEISIFAVILLFFIIYYTIESRRENS